MGKFPSWLQSLWTPLPHAPYPNYTVSSVQLWKSCSGPEEIEMRSSEIGECVLLSVITECIERVLIEQATRDNKRPVSRTWPAGMGSSLEPKLYYCCLKHKIIPSFQAEYVFKQIIAKRCLGLRHGSDRNGGLAKCESICLGGHRRYFRLRRQNTGKLSASMGLLTATTPVLDGLCTEAHIISEQLLHCTLVANQCRAYYDDRIQSRAGLGLNGSLMRNLIPI